MAQNEVWFRDVNERLESRVLARVAVQEAFEIVCECDLEECTERIQITVTEYEKVRQSPTSFIVAPGHSDSLIERVVARADGYDVVTKIGEAASVAGEQDPRG